jgi:hypothetical protein
MKWRMLLTHHAIGALVFGVALSHSHGLVAQEFPRGREGQACELNAQRPIVEVQPNEQRAQAAPATEKGNHTTSSQPRGAGHDMGQYYLGRHQKTGIFPGRLVCLRCDTMPTSENVDVCKNEGHRHALAMEGDAMMHPLIFTSGDLFTKVNAQDWHRKKVQVWGRYYADTGFIVVGDIQAATE